MREHAAWPKSNSVDGASEPSSFALRTVGADVVVDVAVCLREQRGLQMSLSSTTSGVTPSTKTTRTPSGPQVTKRLLIAHDKKRGTDAEIDVEVVAV